MRRALGLSIVLCVACSSGEPVREPPVEPPPPPAPTTPCPDTRADLFDWLARSWLETQLAYQLPAARVLYTWTRAEQIDELRADPTLLTRSEAEGGATSLFDRALAADESPLAQRIREAGDGARRFAWTTPWATRLGWPGGDYGDRLIRMEITDDALVAVYDDTRASPDEGLYTLSGARVELTPPPGDAGEFSRHALREGTLGLVVHVGSGVAEDGTPRPFREVVVIDEAVIARWEYGTTRVLYELGSIRTRFAEFRTTFPSHEAPLDPVAFGHTLLERWRSPPGSSEPLPTLWERSLALASPRYAFERETLDALASALETAQPGPAIDVVHVPGFQPARRARRGGYQPIEQACRHWDPSVGCMDVP